MSGKPAADPANARRAELIAELATHERDHVRNRWVTDKTALTRNKNVKFTEKFSRNAPKRLAKHDMFLKPEDTHQGLRTDPGEVTDRVTQNEILHSVDLQTQRKKFSLHLDKLGPYKIDFSRNGTHMAFAGMRGHVASTRWQDFALDGEVNLQDRCTDVKYVVDHSMLAVAQSKFVYMYTAKCVEMHVLPKFANVTTLGYLPRHMLLVGASSQYSTMQYMDVSTGDEVSSKSPALVQDPTLSMCVNPANGVVLTGDTRGVLKMWSPTVPEPLVQMKGHRGGVNHVACHIGGRYLVSVGADNGFKVWDIRTLRPLEEWKMNYIVDSVDISQSGLVAVGGGTNLQIWKHMFSAARPFRPWMKHNLGYGNVVQSVKFCPFEDVLAIGHSCGITTMIVPGSGEPNPDFFEANPVVRNLLDKLPPDSISLDLQIANVDEERLAEYQQALQANRKARNIKEKKEKRSRPLGDAAPTGLEQRIVGADVDEIDEDLGVSEKGPSKLWKSKKEMAKEKKMVRWDQKDTKDKVRSKQVLRHSRQVMAQRKKSRWLDALKEEQQQGRSSSGGGGADAANDGTGAAVVSAPAPTRARKSFAGFAMGGPATATAQRGGKMRTGSAALSTSSFSVVGDEIPVGKSSSSAAAKPRRRDRDEDDDASGADARRQFRDRKAQQGNAALRRLIE